MQPRPGEPWRITLWQPGFQKHTAGLRGREEERKEQGWDLRVASLNPLPRERFRPGVGGAGSAPASTPQAAPGLLNWEHGRRRGWESRTLEEETGQVWNVLLRAK